MGANVPTGDYDVVLEASGDPSGLQRALELVRRGGTVVLVGTYNPDTTWPFGAAFSKEVGLKWSLGYCGHEGRREFEEAADMLAGRPDLGRHADHPPLCDRRCGRGVPRRAGPDPRCLPGGRRALTDWISRPSQRRRNVLELPLDVRRCLTYCQAKPDASTSRR